MISSCPHIPGPTRSFPIVNKHVSSFCSIRHNSCLSRQRECGVHQPLGQNRAPEPVGDIPCLGPSRLTVWGSCHICCSTRPWRPQPCWKGTRASLAFHSVCTDAPVDLATTDLRSQGRRGSQLLQSRVPAQCPLFRNEPGHNALQSSFPSFPSMGAFGPQRASGDLTCEYPEAFMGVAFSDLPRT